MRALTLLLILCHCFTFSTAQVSGEVKVMNGRPAMIINGNVVNPMLYSLTDVPGGRWSWEELPSYNIKTFCNAGFSLFQVDLFLDHFWKEDGSLDMSLTQNQLRGVLDVCPGATIFIRFHVNPPKWWQKRNAVENTVYADGPAKPDYEWGLQRIIEDDEENPVRTSLASRKWLEAVTPKIRTYLQQLNALPEGNSVAGIHVAGGVYGEWHYWGFIENEPDMSRAMLDYFKQWVARKYGNDRMLQKAWGDKSVSLATVTLPALEERRNTKAGIFRDPRQERKVIDYYEAQHTIVADDIIYFCKLVKDNWPRPIITGAFYGYFYAVFGREAAGGHLELQKVLNSPYVDYLSAPGTYYPEAAASGDAYRPRSLINSVLLHGKLWLDEMDQQPPLVPLKDSTFSASLEKSISTVRRNILATATKSSGLWFYDFGPSGFNGGKRLTDHGSWGWWDEPSLMKDIARVKTALDDKYGKPHQSYADVLLVHDTKSFYYTGSARDFSFMGHWTNNWIPPAIYKSSVIHDVIHIDDLSLINPDQYKAVIFCNTWTMNQGQRDFIKSKLAREGRHLVFLYAPGYCNEIELNVKFMEDVMGVKISPMKLTVPPVAVFRKETGIEKEASVWNRMINPFFVVNDSDFTALATLKETTGTVFGHKKFPGHTVWYSSIPSGDPLVWRYIFNNAGANIYSDHADIIYGGNGVLSIHTAEGGTRKITLRNGKVLEVNFKPNSTRLIDPETGEDIIKD